MIDTPPARDIFTRRRTAKILFVALVLAQSGATPLRAWQAVGFRQLTHTFPVAVQRGTEAEVELFSNFTLDQTHSVLFARPGVTMEFLETEPKEAPRRGRGSAGTPFRFRVHVPDDQPPGVHEYRVATRQAVSSVAQLLVTDYPVVVEADGENGTRETAQSVELPIAVCGRCERFEDVDCFQFEGRAGEEATFEIFAQRVTDRLHGMVVRGPRIYLMDPILTLIGPQGQQVAQNDNWFGGDSLLHATLPVDGIYTLEVRDARFAGDPRYTYCVEMSVSPYLHAVYPPAGTMGSTVDVEPIGFGLGSVASFALAPEEETADWTRVRVPTERGLSTPAPFLWSDAPQVPASTDGEIAGAVEQWPTGLYGRLTEPDQVHRFSFEALEGERFEFEIRSHRLGMPMDAVLEILDDQNAVMAAADDWTDRRTKDAILRWQAPRDGTFSLAVRDLHGRHGPWFLYHVRADRGRPDFEVHGEYYYSMLAPGTNMIWFARVQRYHGFEGPVTIEVHDLPEGVRQVPAVIPAGMEQVGVILQADETAEIGATLASITGRAVVEEADGTTREVVRRGLVLCEQQSSGGGQARYPVESQIVGVTEPLDLLSVRAEPAEIVLAPGEEREVTVQIERADGFTDAVTLAMSFDYFQTVIGAQLPPGVEVTPASQLRLAGDAVEGKVVLKAAQNATAVERLPIAVLARVSVTFSITTNYASNPVYLTIEQPVTE